MYKTHINVVSVKQPNAVEELNADEKHDHDEPRQHESTKCHLYPYHHQNWGRNEA